MTLMYLRRTYRNWTTSNVHSEAWKYRGNFRGFVVWWFS